MRMPRSTSARMSRRAVSWEHLASFAYFDVVSLPSKPSSRRLRTRRWRSLMAMPAIDCQKRALARMAASVVCAPSMARPRQPRNQVVCYLCVDVAIVLPLLFRRASSSRILFSRIAISLLGTMQTPAAMFRSQISIPRVILRACVFVVASARASLAYARMGSQPVCILCAISLDLRLDILYNSP